MLFYNKNPEFQISASLDNTIYLGVKVNAKNKFSISIYMAITATFARHGEATNRSIQLISSRWKRFEEIKNIPGRKISHL